MNINIDIHIDANTNTNTNTPPVSVGGNEAGTPNPRQPSHIAYLGNPIHMGDPFHRSAGILCLDACVLKPGLHDEVRKRGRWYRRAPLLPGRHRHTDPPSAFGLLACVVHTQRGVEINPPANKDRTRQKLAKPRRGTEQCLPALLGLGLSNETYLYAAAEINLVGGTATLPEFQAPRDIEFSLSTFSETVSHESGSTP